jgi:hypothetical protein
MDTIVIDDALKSCLGKVLSHYPIVAAYLYGSVATGQTTPFSDVDIALVVAQNSLPKLKRLEFELEIEEKIASQCNIDRADVRVVNDAPIIFRGEVVTNGILLYCQDDDDRIEFETRSRSEYFDFLPLANMLTDAHLDLVRARGLNGQRL